MLDSAPSSVTEESAAPRPRRKVAIVGTAPNSVAAPFNDPSWEIWGCGFRGAHVTRATRWYEVHNLALEKDGVEPNGKRWEDYIVEWSADCDVWMFFPAQIPSLKEKVRQYPVKHILDRHDPRFLSSSFAWMFAHALHAQEFGEEPVDEIGIWGVDMEGGTEYEEQRVGCFHFIELAKRQGITIRLVASGGLAYRPVPYPFCNDDPFAEKMKLKSAGLEAEKRKYDSMLADAIARKAYLTGQIDLLEKGDQDTKALKAEREVMERTIAVTNVALAEIKGWLDCVAWARAYMRG